MEAAAGRGGTLPVPSSSSQFPRKEWRAVSEHSSFQNGGNEDPEHVKLGQSDERTIYEVQEGTGPLDVDFCSISIDGGRGLSDEIAQQRLQEITRQREELQHVEVKLRAQAIARAENRSWRCRIASRCRSRSMLMQRPNSRISYRRENNTYMS